MDTHVAGRAEIQVEDAEQMLYPAPGGREAARRNPFRPGNREVPAPEPHPRPQETAAPAPLRHGRSGLMTTACLVVVMAAAGGVFWISPYNHYSLTDITRAAARVQDAAESVLASTAPPGPVAPAASLARAPAPSQPTQAANAPSLAHGDEMAMFLRFRSQEAAAHPPRASQATPAASATVANPFTPATARALDPPARALAPQQTAALRPQASGVVAPARQQSAALVAPAAPAGPASDGKTSGASTLPADPVAAVAMLRAAPMTEPQQVQVLDLVAKLGTVVSDQRAEIAQLRQDQQHVGQRVDSALADIGRRVSLAEASRAVNAAMGLPAAPPASPVATLVAARLTAPAASAANIAGHRYHVQAASPGLAMLSELDSAGGEERQLPVSPGEEVPGWGKVVGIAQQGTTWVVKTEHGVIQ